MKARIFLTLILVTAPLPAFALRTCTPSEIADFDIDGPASGLTGEIGPYLQFVTQSSALVEWNAAQPKAGRVVLSRGEDSAEFLTPQTATHHVAGFCDLQPGTEYKYRVDQKPEQAFSTLPPPDAPLVRFAVIGDYGLKGAPLFDVVQQIEKFHPQWIVTTGDNAASSGTYRNFEENLFQPLAKLLATIPFYPSLGNHELYTDNGKPYFNVFTLPHNNPSKTERYYSFDAGPIHFTILDSSTDNSLQDSKSAQVQWLRDDLAATKSPWKMIAFHHSPYSSEYFHGSYEKIRNGVSPIAAKYGVDLVLTGHSHTYERTLPLDGVVYIVTGGGGVSVRNVKSGEPFSAKAIGKTYHFVGITLQGPTLELQAIDRYGAVIDHWSKTKK